ncbi:unnamed protein product [Hermetia illucens]|uniref:Uncharacterized protein n=1 Tax=Hermetia illucens TaxID=343691 RepID=A0A7R8V1X2_HERIL|nr:unnamed protein product [Hermetia illucens]
MEMKNVKKKYKLVPPEGGWGYAVAMGQVLAFMAIFVVMHGYALIFNDFLIEIGMGTSIVALLNSCSAGATSFAGLFCNLLTQRFTERSVGVAAAIAYCFGSFIKIFAETTVPLFVATIIHGAAIGIIFPIVFSSFNQYFVERRAFMASATQIFIGLGKVGAPLGVQYLLDNYGFRGCLAILAAVNCHSILGMLVMHPVEWHMKKVLIIDEEDEKESTKPGHEESPNGKSEDDQQLKPLMVEHEEKSHMKTSPSLRPSAANSRRDSLISAAEWGGSVIISEALEREAKQPKKWKFVRSLLDLTLIEDPIYMNLVVGIVFTFYSDLAFSAFQPLYLFEIDYSQVEVSQVIAVGTAADLVARCVATAISAVMEIRSKLCFFLAVVLSLVARCAFFYANDYWSMIVVTAVIGFLKTWLLIPVGLIFTEYLPTERFASGYGLFMFLQGMFSLGLGPVMQFIRDFTYSYIWVFHALNLLLLINVVTWSLEYIWVRYVGGKKDEIGAESKNAA